MKSTLAARTRATKRKNCHNPYDDDAAEHDRLFCDELSAASGDKPGSGTTKHAEKSIDKDLVRILERLRNSEGSFTEQTNQDCAVLVRRANMLGGTLPTCTSLSGEIPTHIDLGILHCCA